jgi:Mg2+/Co2+ transporter CorB
MTLDDWLAIAVIFVCLLLSFFFSGSETALTASSRSTMLRLAEGGNRKAAMVSRLLSMRERLLGALLLSNNVVNILASSLATSLFLLWFGDVGVLYATIVMTVLVVVFAEILPKTAAINNPEHFSLLAVRPINWVVRLFGPVLTDVERLRRRSR